MHLPNSYCSFKAQFKFFSVKLSMSEACAPASLEKTDQAFICISLYLLHTYHIAVYLAAYISFSHLNSELFQFTLHYFKMEKIFQMFMHATPNKIFPILKKISAQYCVWNRAATQNSLLNLKPVVLVVNRSTDIKSVKYNTCPSSILLPLFSLY